MAIDAFLQFTKAGLATEIAGETQDKIFKKPKEGPAAFEIQQWSFGAANQSTIGSATMGAGGGKASFEPFTVTKNVDRATPYLFTTCCAGGHYPELTLWVRKTGSSPTAAGDWYLQWKFKMAFVSKVAWSNGDPLPTEEVTFVYGAIKFDYREQSMKGDFPDPERYSSWSQVLNAQDFEVPGL
jgi:type VI secretion system secreted protein Hcp